MLKFPRRKLAVVTCMDCRIDPLAALGLQVGDAHVLRNAGGLTTDDTLRSLAISQRALGTIAVAVAVHTDCGMLGFDDAGFRETLRNESDRVPTWDVPGFDDLLDGLRRSIVAIRECPWLEHRDDVRGFVLDVDTGTPREIQAT